MKKDLAGTWKILHRGNIPKVECWYTWGLALEVEWSSIFRGVYFKIGCVEFHIGFWVVLSGAWFD